MNATLFTLIITLMSPVPADSLKFVTTRTVVANLTEQQCLTQRDAAYEDAVKEKKNVIVSCQAQQ